MAMNWLWIVGAATVFAGGLKLFRFLQKKQGRDSEANPSQAEPPEEMSPPKETAPSEDERQRLLKQLRQQREEIAHEKYRQACAALFEGMSGGIQELFAQEKRPCSREPVFCRRLLVSAGNESLGSRIQSRPVFQEPEPVSLETESADEETLREIIRVEKSQCFSPVVEIPWDVLMEPLLDCLEQLLCAAEEDRAADCRRGLDQMRRILAGCNIYPVWYGEDSVQDQPSLQRNFIRTSSYPVPALYYRSEEIWVPVGRPGHTGAEEKKKE